jgi:amino acid adenylation domain-containing protein
MITEQQQGTLHQRLSPVELGQFGSAFPPDRRPPCRTHGRSLSKLAIMNATWSRFAECCAQLGLKPEDALVGLLQILLHRHTVADSIGIGIIRDSLRLVRTDIDGTENVRATIANASHAIEQGIVASFEDIRTLVAQRGAAANQPIVRVLLSVEPQATEGGFHEVSGDCDIALWIRFLSSQRELVAEYECDLYKTQTIERILSQYQLLIESLEEILDRRVDRIPLCRTEEAKSVAAQIVPQKANLPAPQCMHRRFEEQARKTPDAVALVMPGYARREITYSQLNTSANRVAHYLQSMGVGPDVLVGLYLDRTPDLLVGLLAILKAGAAYLPIDLSYPADRVAFMLSDSEAPLVVTDSQTAKNLPQQTAKALCIDTDSAKWSKLNHENPSSSVSPENLAYSIFTSGSTGRPKGVLITHANVSRLFDATQDWFHFNENDAWTLFHSSAFDFSVWEIWGALIYGGRLVIVPFADSRSPERFHDLLASEKITVLNQTPSAFRQLIGIDEKKPQRKLDQLRTVIFGGEALNLQSLAPWFTKYGDAQPQLVNMYGITETTVHVTYRPITKVDLHDSPGSVIGLPIPDLQLYVLDAGLQPVPIGVPGEMFVGGAGVARGYLKRDALTTERFIKNPFSDSDGKLYRSGDLARRLPDGDLEYMGRADQQVKIRGFRVELGEIQSALTKQPGVREAFVTAKELCNGEKALVAYVVPANGEPPAVDRLRRDLESTLPGYMVPANFVFLDHLPLTSNGKIDRAALPLASLRRSEMEQPFLAPQGDLERRIAGIYKEVLQIDKVGIDDNFFDLGGNSLRLVDVHTRLENLVGQQIFLADLFAYTTVRKLAASIGGQRVQRESHNHLLDRAQRQRQAMCARGKKS